MTLAAEIVLLLVLGVFSFGGAFAWVRAQRAATRAEYAAACARTDREHIEKLVALNRELEADIRRIFDGFIASLARRRPELDA